MCMKELMLKSVHDLSYTVLVSEKGLSVGTKVPTAGREYKAKSN